MRGDFNRLTYIIKNNISEIDLSEYDFCEPAFLLWILSLYSDKKISFKNKENCIIKNYLERCGFFWFINHSIHINRTDTNSLVEITEINENTDNKPEILEMDRLTTKFLQNLNLKKEEFDDLYKTFYWIMRELIYNVITHSRADFSKKGCLYMMQSFHDSKRINFCVVDNWVWIKESFKDSSYYDPKLGYEYYIDLALQKWVTRDKDVWAGNWLYWTLEIIKATWSELTFYSWDTYCTQKWMDTNYVSWTGFRQWILLDIDFDINNLNKDVIDNLISKWALVKWLDVDELEHLNDLF